MWERKNVRVSMFVCVFRRLLCPCGWYVLSILMVYSVLPPEAEGDGGFAAWESCARLQRARTGLGRTAGGTRRGIIAGTRLE